MTGKPWIYIASPYTHGDPAINVRAQMEAFDELLTMGAVPIAPLHSHFQHLFRPRPYRHWIELDLEIIQRCDACLRIDAVYRSPSGWDYRQGESAGADAEVAEFKRLGKPVFLNTLGVSRWMYERREAPA